mmetsp:Transcript_33195/g.68518  ORF Transcript_33195/g.68518 Transcript_33195/m.68518 type:complete len:264 (+) Transcript_33195:211-1002(+)
MPAFGGMPPPCGGPMACGEPPEGWRPICGPPPLPCEGSAGASFPWAPPTSDPCPCDWFWPEAAAPPPRPPLLPPPPPPLLLGGLPPPLLGAGALDALGAEGGGCDCWGAEAGIEPPMFGAMPLSIALLSKDPLQRSDGSEESWTSYSPRPTDISDSSPRTGSLSRPSPKRSFKNVESESKFITASSIDIVHTLSQRRKLTNVRGIAPPSPSDATSKKAALQRQFSVRFNTPAQVGIFFRPNHLLSPAATQTRRGRSKTSSHTN